MQYELVFLILYFFLCSGKPMEKPSVVPAVPIKPVAEQSSPDPCTAPLDAIMLGKTKYCTLHMEVTMSLTCRNDFMVMYPDTCSLIITYSSIFFTLDSLVPNNIKATVNYSVASMKLMCKLCIVRLSHNVVARKNSH